MKKIDEKDAEAIFEGRKPQPKDEVVGRSFSLRAEIDPTPQPLNRLRTYEGASLRIPMNLRNEAIIVLKLLFACFEKQGKVAEGLIGDILWGFAQAQPPIPEALTWNGLKYLWKDGYVKFQAPDGSYVDPLSDQIGKSWIRYTPKILSMVYEDLGEIKTEKPFLVSEGQGEAWVDTTKIKTNEEVADEHPSSK